MSKLIDFFARQGLFTNLSTIFVLFVGVYSALTIERKVFPNVDFEFVSVTTIFPGASAEEVERLVTNSLEQELLEVEGVKKMTSVSMDGRSLVLLQLDPDQTTIQKGKADIQDVVDRVTDLPSESEDPLVLAIESKLEPVIQVSISSDKPESEVRAVAKRLEKEVERIYGVAKVEVDGLRDIEYRVEADPKKLRLYQLTLDNLVQALSSQNINVPGGAIEGSVDNPKSEIIVRTVGEFKTIEDVKNSVIRSNVFGKAIRVSDVALVKETFEKATVYQRTNSRDSMNLTILKKVSADAIDVVDDVKKEIERLKETLPDGFYINYINDSSYYIRRRLKVLSGNLVIGLSLVLVILSIVMPWRVAAITAIGIPFAFLGTIYVMDSFAISFNIITMMGLIIVVGMLVDDAIVVTENVVRHMEAGVAPLKAAIRGAQEIWAPVTASVLTTIMAFLPMMSMSGIMGKFIRYIPFAVILALIISLYECFFVLPHHLGSWLGNSLQRKKDKPNKKRSVISRFGLTMVERYTVLVRLIVSKPFARYGVFSLLILIFVGTMMFASKGLQFVLFPKKGIEQFIVKAEAEVGVPLDVMKQRVKQLEELVGKLPRTAMDDYATKIGIQSLGPGDPNTQRGSQFAQIMVYLKPETERVETADELMDDLREKFQAIKSFQKLTVEFVNAGPPVGRAISVGVNGRNYEEILPAVEEIKEIARSIEGAQDVTDTYIEGKEEVRVVVNKAEASAAGLTVSSIGATVRAVYEGLVATTIRLLDEEIDVRVSLPTEDREKFESLEKVQVSNSQGRLIPLNRVAHTEKAKSVAQYVHENNKRQVKVVGNVDEKVTSSNKVNAILQEKEIELRKKYPYLTFSFGGENEDTQESMESLIQTSITALLGISLILILLFGNVWQPLLVVATIPLGVLAVIWAFMLNGMPMSFLGAIGTVALAGVIVNNSIVLIDFVNRAREQGMDSRESIVDASKKRIRPILLTTLTTVCGILPTAYGLGGLDQFVVPVAMALGWGMLFGSILIVWSLPAMIAIQDDFLWVVNGLWSRLSLTFKKVFNLGNS